MGYLENIGKNAKKAFEDLKAVEHSKIKKILGYLSKSEIIHKDDMVLL